MPRVRDIGKPLAMAETITVKAGTLTPEQELLAQALSELLWACFPPRAAGTDGTDRTDGTQGTEPARRPVRRRAKEVAG